MTISSKSLFHASRDLLLFGGKGGVGKTTSAAACALGLARGSPERKVLLVSTDPAHSLGDCLGIRVGHEACRVEGVPNLYVREFDTQKLSCAFLDEHQGHLKTLALRGTYFDGEDVESFLNLSFPGMDEMMALLEISLLLKGGEEDIIIVDTAPTGHTLAMLKLPKLLQRWIAIFDLMQSKHHLLQEHFTRRREADDVDRFLARLQQDLTSLAQHLKDHERTEFVVVMNPHQMSFAETRRLVKSLAKLHIPHKTLIVNRVSASPAATEKELGLEEISSALPDMELMAIPRFESALRGRDLLKVYGEAMMGSSPHQKTTAELKGVASVSSVRISLDQLMNAQMCLIIVAGKGGVGKTTVSAITALALAGRHPKRRFLLLSIDPAHSLADVLKLQIGNKGTEVSPNLFVREIDSAELLNEFRDRFHKGVEELFEAFSSKRGSASGFDLSFDRELLDSFLELSPPGLDELMALYTIVSLWEEPKTEFDCVVLDTAPTGHLIRFLEMPTLVREWLNAILKLLLKYKGIVKLGDLAEHLVSLSKQVREVIAVLTDAKKTQVIAVSVAEPMIVAETKRLLEVLKHKNIAVPSLVANMIRHGVDGEQDELRELHRIASGKVVELPLLDDEVRGVERLKEVGGMLFQ